MKFTDKEIQGMRDEIENPELMRQRIEGELAVLDFIDTTKKMFKDKGRDFDQEYSDWKKRKETELAST